MPASSEEQKNAFLIDYIKFLEDLFSNKSEKISQFIENEGKYVKLKDIQAQFDLNGQRKTNATFVSHHENRSNNEVDRFSLKGRSDWEKIVFQEAFYFAYTKNWKEYDFPLSKQETNDIHEQVFSQWSVNRSFTQPGFYTLNSTMIENSTKMEEKSIEKNKKKPEALGSIILIVSYLGYAIQSILNSIGNAVKDTGKITKLIGILGPIFSGGFVFFSELISGIKGLQTAYNAYNNAKSRNRKIKILSGVSAFMVGGAGAGIGLSSLANLLGASVSGTLIATMPFIGAICFTTIYALSLWRNYYGLQQAERDEEAALLEYLGLLSSKNKADHKVDIARENLEKFHSEFDMDSILKKYASGTMLLEDEEKKYQEYKKERDTYLKEISIQNNIDADIKNKIKEHNERHEKRLRKECKLAFSAVDVFSGCLFVVVALLGTAAIIGASVASFGAVPLAILCVATVIGISSTTLQYQNKKHDYSYTKKMRNWFVGEDKDIISEEKKEVRGSKKNTFSIIMSLKSEKKGDRNTHDDKREEPDSSTDENSSSDEKPYIGKEIPSNHEGIKGKRP